MEVFIFIFLLFIAIWIFSSIQEFFNGRRIKEENNTRKLVASELLNDSDIDNQISNYNDKLKQIHTKFEKIDEENIVSHNTDIIGKFTDYLGGCPKCQSGHLVVRVGKYGKFLGCSSFPSCKYTKNITHAKNDYKEAVNKQIHEDIKRAYSII